MKGAILRPYHGCLFREPDLIHPDPIISRAIYERLKGMPWHRLRSHKGRNPAHGTPPKGLMRVLNTEQNKSEPLFPEEPPLIGVTDIIDP
jgi:hypothetical protein